MPFRISREEFGQIVDEVLGTLPAQFADFVAEVPIEVMDNPTPRQLQGLDSGHTLLGLYHGRSRPTRNVEDSGAMPDAIYLFQQPLQNISRSRDELAAQIRITLLHEIGHHFGLNEDDLRNLGY